MRTKLSTRREKFNRLVAAASVQSSEWLIAVFKDEKRNDHMTALARLAALRVLVYRNYDPGLPYPMQKKLARIAFGI
jgi:FPC/CPF motif-containing protein YcgG